MIGQDTISEIDRKPIQVPGDFMDGWRSDRK